MSDTPFFRSGITRLLRIAHLAGIDSATLFGMSARVWSMGSGVVTLLLVGAYFSREIQGYYYTFMNLIALQVFAEMGLGQVLIQFAAHEWASLRLDEHGNVEGDAVAKGRLSGLAHFALRWFVIASVLFLVGIEGAGFYIFEGASPKVAWMWPWTFLCVTVVFDLCLLPLWSLLEGTNQVAAAYSLRFSRAVASGLALWAGIAIGAGLWSAAISIAFGILVMVALAFRRHYRFFYSLFSNPDRSVTGWWAELWPMQWRMALSWLSGYLYLSLFTPVLFKFHGAVVAGQMGMTWNLVQSLSAISGIVMQTKAPAFAMLVAQRNWVELDRLGLRFGLTSVLLTLLGGACLFMLIYAAQLFHIRLVARMLPMLPFTLFLLGTVVTQSTGPIAVYLRAHKREPLLVLSLTLGLLTGASTIVLGYYFGALGMAVGYLAVALLVSFPGGIFVFLRCRRIWHAADYAS